MTTNDQKSPKVCEAVSEAVRDYLCLLDEYDENFKDEAMKNRAWLNIARDLADLFEDVNNAIKNGRITKLAAH